MIGGFQSEIWAFLIPGTKYFCNSLRNKTFMNFWKLVVFQFFNFQTYAKMKISAQNVGSRNLFRTLWTGKGIRTNVTAVLNILGTLFFHPSFFGLNQWFRAKNIWKTHQSRSQRSKRAFLEFSKKNSEKSWVFSEKKKIAKKWSNNSKIFPNLFQT